jgi:hypothetical protein
MTLFPKERKMPRDHQVMRCHSRGKSLSHVTRLSRKGHVRRPVQCHSMVVGAEDGCGGASRPYIRPGNQVAIAGNAISTANRQISVATNGSTP